MGKILGMRPLSLIIQEKHQIDSDWPGLSRVYTPGNMREDVIHTHTHSWTAADPSPEEGTAGQEKQHTFIVYFHLLQTVRIFSYTVV